MVKISSSHVIHRPADSNELPLFSNKKISGNSKVCDKKTGECWEVKDGKPGETPPVTKTKEEAKGKEKGK